MTIAVCEEPGTSEEVSRNEPSAPPAVSVRTTGSSSAPSRNSRMLLATAAVSASAITALIVILSRDGVSALGVGVTNTTVGRSVAEGVGTKAR